MTCAYYIPGQHGCRKASNSFTDQTPHSSWHGEAENHIPRRATTNNKSPNLNSATDPGLRSATQILTQRQQHTCTRRAALKFSIGGREAIRQYFIVRGGSNNSINSNDIMNSNSNSSNESTSNNDNRNNNSAIVVIIVILLLIIIIIMMIIVNARVEILREGQTFEPWIRPTSH